MKNNRNDTRNIIKRTATGAILAATATVLLVIGGIFEILDMTSAAIASVAILVSYLEFGAGSALGVYAVSAVISLMFFPTSTATIYYALLLGYYPVLKFTADRKLKRFKALPTLIKFVVFNGGCALILFLFSKIYGLDAVLAELEFGAITGETVIFTVFVMLNIFFIMFDMLLNSLAVIYIKVLRKRIFGRKRYFH